MAFASTATITINAVDYVLNRINQDSYGSEYYLVNAGVDSLRMKVRHSVVKAGKDGVQYDRHNWEVTRVVFATATVPELTEKFYGVYQVPSNYDTVGAKNAGQGVISYFANTTRVTDIFNWLN